MALLALQEPGTSLGYRDGGLVVLRGEAIVRRLREDEVDEVHLYGARELTAAARSALLRRSIDVLFFDMRGRFMGRLSPPESANACRRQQQYRCLDDAGQVLALARAVVQGKLANQRTFLQRLQRERSEERIADACTSLRHLLQRVASAPDLDSLRGYEGAAAAAYFRALSAAVRNPEMPFSQRTRRPPRDAFNACLSMGYTLLLQQVIRVLHRVGLEPSLGALHEAGRNKPALALDLMEEFRTPVVDRLVLRLVNRRQLTAADFEDPRLEPEDWSPPEEEEEQVADPRPPVYLGPSGRAVFLPAFGEQMRQRQLYLEKRHTYLQILESQAYALVRFVEEGEAYCAFKLQ